MYEERYGNQTQYKGEYFDSETEAAWAAYFDAAGMPYQHEPETFILEGFLGRHIYTPDYYLPEQDTYVENKSNSITLEACDKLAALARSIGKACIMTDGKPHNMIVYFFAPTSTKKSYEVSRPYNHYADLDLYPWQTRPDDDAPRSKPYAGLITAAATYSRNIRYTSPTDAQIKEHWLKKNDLANNMRDLSRIRSL